MTHIQIKVKNSNIVPSSVGQGPPPPYKPSVDQNPDLQSDTNLMLRQKIADLEDTIEKNTKEMHRMQQELNSDFKKQLDALIELKVIR